jgi:hypothetical protein
VELKKFVYGAVAYEMALQLHPNVNFLVMANGFVIVVAYYIHGGQTAYEQK